MPYLCEYIHVYTYPYIYIYTYTYIYIFIRWRRETWWWNEHVEKAIAAKRKVFKAWKAGRGTRASYDAAKRNARHAVHHARQEADKKVYENIDPKSSEVYALLTSLEERTLMFLVTNL